MLAAAHGFLTSPIWPVVGIVFGVAGIGGAAIAVLRTNLATSTIDLLKDNNDALKDRVAVVERDNAACQADNAAKTTQLDQQAQQIKMLADMVSGATAIKELTVVINGHHQELLEAIARRNP